MPRNMAMNGSRSLPTTDQSPRQSPGLVNKNRLWLWILFASVAMQAVAAPGPPSQSKISVHLLVNYSPGAAQIIQTRPRVIKILGTDSGMMQAARDFKA